MKTLNQPRNATPATEFFLTIEFGYLVVQYKSTQCGAAATRRIRDSEDYTQFFTSKAHEAGVSIGDLHLLCSSSLDFPTEYTDRKDVIELCNAIRN